MPDTGRFTLSLTPERLAGFCRQIRQRSGDSAQGLGQALQQLTAVQALLGLGAGDIQSPAWLRARELLDGQLDELRTELLARHAAQLAAAIRQRDTAAIARSFTALSRSGFGTAAAQAWRSMDAGERRECGRWVDEWHRDAGRRATTASRYPDAPDFRAAGIALEEYLALQELRGVAQAFDDGVE